MGQGKVREIFFFKVRELSGNFEICQGKTVLIKCQGKVREF